MEADGSMFLSCYRRNLLGRAPGDRSMNLLSVPSAMLDRSSRSSPEVGIPQTCLPSCLQKTQTTSSVLTAAATLLPRWLNDTYLSVRPSRTVLRPQGGMTAEQTVAEMALFSQKAVRPFSSQPEDKGQEAGRKQDFSRSQDLPAEQNQAGGEPAAWQEAGGSPSFSLDPHRGCVYVLA